MTKQTSSCFAGSVRRASLADLRNIVSVHTAAFPGFFLSHMGPRFLAQYYRLVLEFDHGILLVAETNAAIQGFVAGFVDPDQFRIYMSSQKRRFILPTVLGVLRNPLILRRVLANVRKVTDKSQLDPANGRACELASIAVLPAAGSTGIGKRLVIEFLNTAAKDADYVYLTTDACNNDSVNAFYNRLDFQLASAYVAPGNRKMNKYIRKLGEPDASS